MAHSASLSIPNAGLNRIDDGDDLDATNESTRLLPGNDEEAARTQTPTPLPKAQLGALFAVRIVDPIAYQQIFPYINQLLADLRVAEPEQVGFYSGLVESAYSLAQVFSVYQWGRISDIVGRRPVVFTGLVGIAVTTIAFGLSTSFAGIVASRFFGGLVAGNVAVIHTILAEITDDTNQDLAVPIYSLAWPVGTVVGPLIGGTLANAAMRYPQYFSWRVFVEHPYLPPCTVSAVCALIGAGLGYSLIEETLPSKRKDLHAGTHAPLASGTHTDTHSDEVKPASVMELLSIPAIRALTISGFALTFLSLAFDVVFTLFCYTPIDAGGLGLEPSTIGNVLAFAGMLAVLLRFFAMPYILRRFDYAKTYNACMCIWPVAFGFLPFLNILARADPPSTLDSLSVSTTSVLIWTGLLTLLALSKIGAIPHSLSMLLIKRHAPSPSSLGRSNGLVQFAMCVGRAIGPVAVSTLFTGINGMDWVRRWGVGWVWAVGMVVGALAGARVTRGIGSGTRS
ncbi:major facilitator superfamily domain-containing protein [Boletus reticuloceps]|uniref:Major facilitator superfamily domain-containing protein n=1 Tax=Boletus reticuloceps TaxID=495285 RepID=A0A8I2YEU5_9AGAM|nr:major facilitator superfamily domain-containing protein [Boletus reticuloceps]